MSNKYLDEYLKINLRKCQLKQLDILIEIDKVCKKNGISYWLDGGTLLGAVRHKGYIPWDDDIDIAMTGEDYSKFCNIAQKELPPNLFLQTKKTDPKFKMPITKVRDLNSLFIEYGDDFSTPYQKGIFVDIFPFVPCAELPLKMHKKITKGISKSYTILHNQHYYSLRSAAELIWFGVKYYLFSAIWYVSNALSKRRKYYSNIPINNGIGHRHEVATIFPLGTIDFEGFNFSAPNSPDQYLKNQYGDYMKIPPVEKRVVHACFFQTKLIDKTTSEIQ